MKEGIIDVAPRFDDATTYSTLWNRRLLETDIIGKISALLLEDEATRSKFMPLFREWDTILFFDHGNENGLIDQNSSYLLNVDDTKDMKDMRVFAMACLSAKKFGLEAYKHGCKEYWGAVESIGFTPDEEELFGEVFVLGAYQRFHEGKSIIDVLQAMEDKFNENIDKATNYWTKVWLRADRDMWRCWSDETPPDDDDTDCWGRRLAVKLFGTRGWKIPSLSMLRRYL